jgi:hypothetical protein
MRALAEVLGKGTFGMVYIFMMESCVMVAMSRSSAAIGSVQDYFSKEEKLLVTWWQLHFSSIFYWPSSSGIGAASCSDALKFSYGTDWAAEGIDARCLKIDLGTENCTRCGRPYQLPLTKKLAVLLHLKITFAV